MSTENDDLSYYEHELPKIIAGVRRGERWEAAFIERDDYYMPKDQSLNGMTKYISQNRRVRLAPVPVVKTWDSVEDFPLNAYWLRERDTGNIYRIEGCTGEGVVYSSRGNWPKVMEWDELGLYDWSPLNSVTNWYPCIKPEGGK